MKYLILLIFLSGCASNYTAQEHLEQYQTNRINYIDSGDKKHLIEYHKNWGNYIKARANEGGRVSLNFS